MQFTILEFCAGTSLGCHCQEVSSQLDVLHIYIPCFEHCRQKHCVIDYFLCSYLLLQLSGLRLPAPCTNQKGKQCIEKIA
jgi:hypothetical protein